VSVLEPILDIVVVSLVMYFVGFTVAQSIVLALIVTLLFTVAKERGRNRLTPFSVTIHPNWHLLLSEKGLFGEQQMEAFSAEYEAGKTKTYSVLQHGISFTVLPPVAPGYSAKGWPPSLIYLQHRNIFISRANLFEGVREVIECLSAPWTHLDTEDGGKMPLMYTPFFYVRLREVRNSEVGLEIGMTTPESFQKASEHQPDSALLPIAILPAETFECFFRPEDFDFSSSGGQRRFHRHSENLKKRLTESDWIEELEDGLTYRHKYVNVYIREII